MTLEEFKKHNEDAEVKASWKCKYVYHKYVKMAGVTELEKDVCETKQCLVCGRIEIDRIVISR